MSPDTIVEITMGPDKDGNPPPSIEEIMKMAEKLDIKLIPVNKNEENETS